MESNSDLHERVSAALEEHPDAATISDDDIIRIVHSFRNDAKKPPMSLYPLVWYHNILHKSGTLSSQSIQKSIACYEREATFKLKKIGHYESPICQTHEMLKELALASRSRVQDYPKYAKQVQEISIKFETLIEFLLPKDYVCDLNCLKDCIRLKGIIPTPDFYCQLPEMNDPKAVKDLDLANGFTLFTASNHLFVMIIPETFLMLLSEFYTAEPRDLIQEYTAFYKAYGKYYKDLC